MRFAIWAFVIVAVLSLLTFFVRPAQDPQKSPPTLVSGAAAGLNSFKWDQSGRLAIDKTTLAALQTLLATEPSDVANAKTLATQGLAKEQAVQVADLVERWYAYRRALQDQGLNDGSATERVRDLQVEIFGADAAAALFGNR
jgi:hypothetical protein